MIYDSDGFERQPQIGGKTIFSQGAKQGHVCKWNMNWMEPNLFMQADHWPSSMYTIPQLLINKTGDDFWSKWSWKNPKGRIYLSSNLPFVQGTKINKTRK